MPKGYKKDRTKLGFQKGNQIRKGIKLSEKTKIKMSEAKKGKRLSEVTKQKIREFNLGKKHSPETIEKMKLIRKGTQSGENNNNWQGGKSFELYGFEWTELLRHSIRTRDCFVCQICKKNGWVVHHIDYNKQNNNPNNLITLCRSCHTKTNYNREYWIKYFNNKSYD